LDTLVVCTNIPKGHLDAVRTHPDLVGECVPTRLSSACLSGSIKVVTDHGDQCILADLGVAVRTPCLL
jgi:hypothetical protein